MSDENDNNNNITKTTGIAGIMEPELWTCSANEALHISIGM